MSAGMNALYRRRWCIGSRGLPPQGSPHPNCFRLLPCVAQNVSMQWGPPWACVCVCACVECLFSRTPGWKSRSDHNNMHRFHGNTKICGKKIESTGRIAAEMDGHRAERDPNQSFRTMYFIFPHSSDAFGGGGGNITPQV